MVSTVGQYQLFQVLIGPRHLLQMGAWPNMLMSCQSRK